MKIIVLNVKRALLYGLVFAAVVFAISAVSLTGMDVLGVFSGEKDIPIYSVDTDKKLTSITFDCAWGADDIPDILKALKEADVKATFFIVGQWAEKYPEKVKMIARDGHDVANHSYSHLRMGGLDGSRTAYEIKKCGEVLESISGTKCDLFRAPYGEYSNALLAEAKRQGFYTIQWDVDSLDWRPGISMEEITQRIHTKIRPGSILLFHNDTAHTAKLLPSILSSLKSSGYEFAPVSKLILREHYQIDDEGRQKSDT
jgi:polysaccharide deacetylase family sporulation protein PdaB